LTNGDKMSEPPTPPRRPGDVYFFATCLVDQFFPGAGMDAITLLEREGIRVISRGTDLLRPAGLHQRFPRRSAQGGRAQLTLFPATGRSSCLPAPAPA
jgi:L-lactate dehydrogenase complex protein LldE